MQSGRIHRIKLKCTFLPREKKKGRKKERNYAQGKHFG